MEKLVKNKKYIKNKNEKGIPFRSHKDIVNDAGDPFFVWSEIFNSLSSQTKTQYMFNLFPNGSKISSDVSTYLFWVAASILDIKSSNNKKLSDEIIQSLGFDKGQGTKGILSSITRMNKIREYNLYKKLRKDGVCRLDCYALLNQRSGNHTEDVWKNRIKQGRKYYIQLQRWHEKNNGT